MAKILSHNIKGPLAYIQHITGYTLAHFDDLSRADLLDTTKVINETARELTNLLTNMLVWQELQAQTLAQHAQTFSLSNLVADEINLQRTACHLKSITITNRVPEKTDVTTDPFLVRLILQNMLTNAIKFSSENSTVHIEAGHENGLLSLCVVDHGKGIPADELAKIEQNHGRTTSSGTYNEQGTGLGMRIMKELAALLNGKITLHSTPGEGTTVTLHIPA